MELQAFNTIHVFIWSDGTLLYQCETQAIIVQVFIIIRQVHGDERPIVSSEHEGAGNNHQEREGPVLLDVSLESCTFAAVSAAEDGLPVM